MKRQRKIKTSKVHLGILVNKSAGRFRPRMVKDLIAAISKSGGFYSVWEPESAVDFLKQAQVAAGLRKSSSKHTAPFAKGGKITGLVAVGGDGTINLAARAAVKADLPLGIIPAGRFNNIANSLCAGAQPEEAIKRIMAGTYRKIDTGKVADQLFVGSVGIGLMPQVMVDLAERTRPRMSVGWSRLGSRAAADVAIKKFIIKVDSFLFEVSPIIFNVNLLSHSGGLRLSPASILDDGAAEVIMDHGEDVHAISRFIKGISSGEYLYGEEVRQYRGKYISCQPVTGQKLYIDGELIDLPLEVLDIEISDKQLKVYC